VGLISRLSRPTYQLQLGHPRRSNALAIAARLGLSGDVIASAPTCSAARGDGEGQQVIRGWRSAAPQQEAAEDCPPPGGPHELLP